MVCHLAGSPTRIGIAKPRSSAFQRYETVFAASSKVSSSTGNAGAAQVLIEDRRHVLAELLC